MVDKQIVRLCGRENDKKVKRRGKGRKGSIAVGRGLPESPGRASEALHWGAYINHGPSISNRKHYIR